MSTVRLAAFVGKGDLFNAAIRRRTKAQESHTELVIDGLWYSSSVGDGGVRRKHIDPQEGDWKFLDLPWADAAQVKAWFDANEEKRYGIWDIIFQLFSIRRDGAGEICSEACAEALGFMSAWKYTPSKLYKACQQRNIAWEASHCDE